MKKILFLLTILSLFAYGCNRDERPADEAGMQEEEQLGTESQAYPQDEQVSPDANVEEIDPDMQEEQVRPHDPSMDSDPGMQEEEVRGEEPGTFDPAMEEPVMEDSEVVE